MKTLVVSKKTRGTINALLGGVRVRKNVLLEGAGWHPVRPERCVDDFGRGDRSPSARNKKLMKFLGPTGAQENRLASPSRRGRSSIGVSHNSGRPQEQPPQPSAKR